VPFYTAVPKLLLDGTWRVSCVVNGGIAYVSQSWVSSLKTNTI